MDYINLPNRKEKFSKFLENKEFFTFFLIAENQLESIILSEKIHLKNGILMYTDLEEAINNCDKNCQVFQIDMINLHNRNLKSSLINVDNFNESIFLNKTVVFEGVLDPEEHDIRKVIKEDLGEFINEGKQESTLSSQRLRKIVSQFLNRSKNFRDNVDKIQIQKNKLKIFLTNGDVLLFAIERDTEGIVQNIVYAGAPEHRTKVRSLVSTIRKAFETAGFQQVIEDACNGDEFKLIMLDYLTLNGGRKTRLVESYSYRTKIPKYLGHSRSYFYGWNVESGGIRSYILDGIKGARLTDMKFEPRFLVEVGKNITQNPSYTLNPNVPKIITDKQIESGHKNFELKGGKGKIIKRLGKAVKRK